MRLLLDTHTLVWWIRENPDLSAGARQAMTLEGNEVLVSVVSAWEIAIKVGLGKWPEAKILLETFEHAMLQEGFALLQITIPHVRAAGLMRSAHRDPFDRLLASQAVLEGLTLVTADTKIAGLGSLVLW